MPNSSLPSIVSKLPNDVRQFLERVREALGGTGRERFIRASDLASIGVADVTNNGQLLQPGTMACTQPPAPIDIVITGAMTNIMIEWGGTEYPCHAYTEIWRSGVDDIGSSVLIGTSNGKIYADSVGSSATYYYWLRFVNKQNLIGPYNDTVGTLGQTAPDPGYLLEQLTGQITESQLYNSLGSRIDLIDDPTNGLVTKVAGITSDIDSINIDIDSINIDIDSINIGMSSLDAGLSSETQSRIDGDTALSEKYDLVYAQSNSNAAAIQSEAITRADADGALSSQITTLFSKTDSNLAAIQSEAITRADADGALSQQINFISAKSTGLFDSAKTWDFETSTEGWTGHAIAPVSDSGFLVINGVESDPFIVSPSALNIDGTKNNIVQARIQRFGTPSWEGRLYWRDSDGTGFTQTKSMAVSEPIFDSDGYAVVKFESVPFVNLIIQIRLDFIASQDAGNYIKVDWVSIGSNAPGVGQAALKEEAIARSDADSALSQQITTVAATADANTVAIQSESTARADADGQLFAQYTVKIDNAGYVSGFGLASTPVDGTPFSEFIVRADRFAIGSPGQADTIPFVVQSTPILPADILLAERF